MSKTTTRALELALALFAAFGAYFCMYAFRKPFSAASFSDWSWGDFGLKGLLVVSQTLGYTLSKILGIRWVSAMHGAGRAWAVLGLILIAQITLLLFAIVPHHWKIACMFANGLPLGMVFGLVASYLEGRATSEMLTAGLCASFIMAGDVMKSMGSWFLQNLHVDPYWMPFWVGAAFFTPLVIFCALLSRIAPPTEHDIILRGERPALNGDDRRQFLGKYWRPLTLIVVPFALVTALRSLRDDFAPEIWRDLLGSEAPPQNYAITGAIVTAGVLASSALLAAFRDNRRAYQAGVWVCVGGLFLLAGSIIAQRQHLLSEFSFMSLAGLGLYLPYAATHTSLLERFLATVRDRGNFGFLMYIADSVGYLGSSAIVLVSNLKPLRNAIANDSMLQVFTLFAWLTITVSCLCYWAALTYLPQTTPRQAA